MKQAKKLLSLVLALAMMVGVFSVVGNAALVKNQVRYDSIDNAALTAEQAADVLLDYVDEILPNDEVDLSVLGTLHLDTLNQLIPDVYDLLDSFVASIAGGDVTALRNQRSILKGWNRTGNNIAAVQKLLQFFGSSDVRGVVAKAPYGLLTNNGIKVGSLINGIVAGLVDLDDINGILTDLPGYLTKMVFDGLLYGSYPYQGARYDYEDSAWTGLPTEANNIDKILNVAANNLLTKPQDNSWKNVNDTDRNGVRYGDYTTAMGKGEVSEDGKQVKIWDMNSVVSKTFTGSIDITTKSFFQVLDTLLPYAYDEFGIHGLNHTLKKTIMEAMGVDFAEMDYADIPAGAQAAFGTDVNAAYCDYAMKDLLWKDAETGYWYYTDVRTRALDLDNDGLDDVDADGNVIKDKTRVYFAANLAEANGLVDLLDWDYEFDGTSFGTADSASGISQTVSTYGSVFGSLNHLLFLILDIAGNDEVITRDGSTIKDAEGNVVWTDGDSSVLNANLLAAVKFTLKNYSATIFGKDNAYVDADGNVKADFLAEVEAGDIIDLVAYIGLPLFNDAMPQLIMPKNADGTFAFHDGSQVFEFGALVIREFLTDIAPAINYDSDIFSVLPSAGSRQMKVHSNQEWYNIILNMGLDVAYTFLNGYTNFNTAIPAKGVTADRWNGMLTTIATWAVNYVGSGSSSALAKLDPNTVTAKGNGFAMLDYALNTLLPLGFVSNCSGNGYDFDLEALFNKIYNIADSFDIAGLLSIIGRNTAAADNAAPNGVKMGNILNNVNVVKQVLDLAQRILYLVAGTNLLPATTNCATLLTSANIGTLASNLLAALNNRSGDLLNNLLPVVIVFFPEFAGEQELGTPTISLPSTIDLSNGTLSGATFTVANGSKGVWRHGYLQDGTEYQDNQYAYKLTGVKAYNIDGSACSNVNVSSYPTANLDFGQSGNVTYNVTGVGTAGKVVRFVISYIVYNEDSQAMAGGKEFKIQKYCYLSYNKTDARSELLCTDARDAKPYVYSPHYVDFNTGADTIPGLTTYKLKNTASTGRNGSLVSQNTAAVNGIALSSWGGTSKNSSISIDKDSSTTSNNFTVNATAYNAAVANGTIKAGTQLSWAVKGYGFALIGSGSDNGTQNIVLKFYDGSYLNKLKSLVSDETGKMRLAEEYNTTGVVYANKVLSCEPDENGLYETAFANTGINPDGDPETQVTVIDCATAWATYQAALQAAIRGAWQEWNGNSVYNHEQLYKDLYTAAKDVNYCKMTAEQISAAAAAAAGSSESVDALVLDLKAKLDGYKTAMADFGEADYASWRWERFVSARSDANKIVSAYNAQNYAVPDDEFFPYNTGLDEATLNAAAAQTPFNAYIMALKEAYTAEQMEGRVTALENAKIKYAGYQLLDVEQAENLLTRTYNRLLTKDIDAELYFLNQEIDSAEVLYGETNGLKGVTYSQRSWAAYTDALAAAKAEATQGGNSSRFDAKYALQVAVNNLRTEEDEADYEELEALMEQASYILYAGAANYSNTNKEFGQLLAALGYQELAANGQNVQLFPNGAEVVSAKSYAADDQKKVDNAANALRKALSAMTFKNVTVPANEMKVAEDADGNAITASVARIAQKLTVDDTKAALKITGADTEVSLNGTYALVDYDDAKVFTGTGSSVTFYKTVSGVKLPVATVNILVDGDVNGDGVVDALDASAVELVAGEHASLSGLFFLAGNQNSADEVINAADYGKVVNLAYAG